MKEIYKRAKELGYKDNHILEARIINILKREFETNILVVMEAVFSGGNGYGK